jgi:hypothetical protein
MITGTTAALRPSGIGRYFGAVFLSLWLVGWVLGELFALAFLGAILSAIFGFFPGRLPAGLIEIATSGAAGFGILFLLVWLTFWTFGGILAWTSLLRSLAGEDTMSVERGELELIRRGGPFRRRYAFERSAIRRVRIRAHDKALVADTNRGTIVLTEFGSSEEREAIGAWLRQRLALADERATGIIEAFPEGWEVTSSDGSTVMRKVQKRARAVRSLISWLVTGFVAAAWFASLGVATPAGNVFALALTVALAVGAATSTWGRREWIVRPGELTFRRSFASWSGEQAYRRARLEVTHHTDSDNDSHYKLVVADGDRRKVVHAQMNDTGEVVDLGRWLADRTGFPLTLPRELRPRS